MTPAEAVDALTQIRLLQDSIKLLKERALGVLDKAKQPKLRLVRSENEKRQDMGTNGISPRKPGS